MSRGYMRGRHGTNKRRTFGGCGLGAGVKGLGHGGLIANFGTAVAVAEFQAKVKENYQRTGLTWGWRALRRAAIREPIAPADLRTRLRRR